MSYSTTHIRWADVLERKDHAVLPFLRFYREVGLVPEPDARVERRPSRPPELPRGRQ